MANQTELLEQIRNEQIFVVLQNNKVVLLTPDQRPKTLAPGSAILKLFYVGNSQDPDLLRMVYDLVEQTRDSGITHRQLWSMMEPFYSPDSDSRVLNGVLRALQHSNLIHSRTEGSDKHSVVRYFTKANAPQSELIIGEDRQIFGNVKTLQIPQWSVHKEFENPVRIEVCFGCPTIETGILVAGQTTIILTTATGRQFEITEPVSVALRIQE